MIIFLLLLISLFELIKVIFDPFADRFGDAIDKEDPVEMVIFMHDLPGVVAREALFMGFALKVSPLHGNLVGPNDGQVERWER